MVNNPNELYVTLLSPAASYFDGEVTYAQIPVHDGLVGILPGHAPMISLLGFGHLILRGTGEEKIFVVDGGFLEIKDNQISILANAIEDAYKVDPEKAARALEAALLMNPSNEYEMETRSNKIAAARSRLKKVIPD